MQSQTLSPVYDLMLVAVAVRQVTGISILDFLGTRRTTEVLEARKMFVGASLTLEAGRKEDLIRLFKSSENSMTVADIDRIMKEHYSLLDRKQYYQQLKAAQNFYITAKTLETWDEPGGNLHMFRLTRFLISGNLDVVKEYATALPSDHFQILVKLWSLEDENALKIFDVINPPIAQL